MRIENGQLRVARSAIVLLLFLSGAIGAVAQSGQSELSGYVTDEQGALICGTG